MWIDDTKASDEEILRYFQLMRGKSTNPSDEVYKAFRVRAFREFFVHYLEAMQRDLELRED